MKFWMRVLTFGMAICLVIAIYNWIEYSCEETLQWLALALFFVSLLLTLKAYYLIPTVKRNAVMSVEILAAIINATAFFTPALSTRSLVIFVLFGLFGIVYGLIVRLIPYPTKKV